MRKLGIVLVMLALMGCARSDDSAKPLESAITSAAPAPTPCAVDGAAEGPKTEAPPDETAAVTDVRYNAEGCPRVVFQFAGDRTPGYKVEYASGPFEDCGSGATVDTSTWKANAFISVRLSPSGGVDLSKSADPTYKGPRDIAVDGTVLKHLKVTCDFEAVFTWIIGLDAKHPFKIEKMTNPSRLILDVSETS